MKGYSCTFLMDGAVRVKMGMLWRSITAHIALGQAWLFLAADQSLPYIKANRRRDLGEKIDELLHLSSLGLSDLQAGSPGLRSDLIETPRMAQDRIKRDG